MNNPTSLLVLLFFLFIFNIGLGEINTKADNGDAKLYIVYLGHKPHDDHELITDSHHDILGQVAGSKEEAKNMMVYSYRHGFSGFAAKLTDSQAKQIGELPGVVRVMENRLYKPHTSRSWDFLGLSKNVPNNLLHKTNQGDGIIIGVFDTGITGGGAESFSDIGLGPIPSKWKGICKSDGKFNATQRCNRKVIGARWYIKGLMEAMDNKTMFDEMNFDLSPLDDIGHGTHCASTAAGSSIDNVEHYGLNMRTVRGGAPLARIAVYKVCWKVVGCVPADVLAAFDDAIKDGVDIITASLGGSSLANPADIDDENVLGIGSFHAVSHGIHVVAAGGNSGPDSYTVVNTAPWITTVAATNDDRDIVTPLTLGNNKTILGDGIIKGKERNFAPLFVALDLAKPEDIVPVANEIKGKVLVIFFQDGPEFIALGTALRTSGILALITAVPPLNAPPMFYDEYNPTRTVPFPRFFVDVEQGNQIFDYFQQSKSNNQNPVIKVGRSVVLEGNKVSLRVPQFSSRGPSAFAPEILKPDVAAPGVNILAAYAPIGFQLESGTSMAAPHVAGIVALLKAAHPNWSPAAIKSALVTTAWNEDTVKAEIFSEGAGDNFANPFDFGGGIANANGAADPGLVYDMDNNDYLNYICGLGYGNQRVQNVTTRIPNKKNPTPRAGIVCPKRIPSRLDLNLPSISIPNLKDSVTIKRTVTNVGDVNSMYKLVVKPPRNVAIEVSPKVLKFNSKTRKISFEVKITSTFQMSTKFSYGSLAWSDGKHFVRIPIAVRKQVDV